MLTIVLWRQYLSNLQTKLNTRVENILQNWSEPYNEQVLSNEPMGYMRILPQINMRRWYF